MKFFKKKSEVDNLRDKYEKLMKEYHRLSTIDRSASDAKYVEATELLSKIDKLSEG